MSRFIKITTDTGAHYLNADEIYKINPFTNGSSTLFCQHGTYTAYESAEVLVAWLNTTFKEDIVGEEDED